MSENAAPLKKIIVMGGSPWSVRAARKLLNSLSATIDSAICLVVHETDAALIERFGTLQLPFAFARNGQLLEKGHVYIAPPDEHLLISDGKAYTTVLPRMHGQRPAIDPLFRSAADAYGKGVSGVLLSPEQEDGGEGLQMIRRQGGKTAMLLTGEGPFSPDRPAPAKDMDADFSSPLPEEIARWLVDAKAFPGASLSARPPVPEPAMPAPLICPDCGGPLTGKSDEGGPRFHCHVGHVFAPAALHKYLSEAGERALWSAVRALEEKTMLARYLAERARLRDLQSDASILETEAAEATEAAASIRQLIQRPQTVSNGKSKT